jgi:hypothetical protein
MKEIDADLLPDEWPFFHLVTLGSCTRREGAVWNGIDPGRFFGHIPKLYCRVCLQAWQFLGFAPVEPVFFFNT